MKCSEFKLGMRVKRRSDSSSFVQDRRDSPHHKGRRIGIVVGLPEAITRTHRVVTVQWEGSSRTDKIHVHRLEALPIEEQPKALGGEWERDGSTFIANHVRRKNSGPLDPAQYPGGSS